MTGYDLGQAMLCAASALAGGGLVGLLAMARVRRLESWCGRMSLEIRNLAVFGRAESLRRGDLARECIRLGTAIEGLSDLLGGPSLADGGAASACVGIFPDPDTEQEDDVERTDPRIDRGRA